MAKKEKATTTTTTKTTTATSTATSTSTTTPKTVLDKVIFAIRQSPKTKQGVSRVAITKYIKSEFDYDNSNAIKKALKKGIDDGKLIQSGQSFHVSGDSNTTTQDTSKEETVQIIDIKIGDNKDDTAEPAKEGDTVIMKYVGKLVSDGSIFDSSNKFDFVLGAGEVIKGWDIGIVGMYRGGIRTLIIPSKLGYGKRGSLPEIPPNADLEFTVTLKSIIR